MLTYIWHVIQGNMSNHLVVMSFISLCDHDLFIDDKDLPEEFAVIHLIDQVMNGLETYHNLLVRTDLIVKDLSKLEWNQPKSTEETS